MYFFNKIIFLIIFCCCITMASFAKKQELPVVGGGLHKPMCFIENKGQVTDLNNKPRWDVQYKLSSNGVNIYLSNNQLHYQFKKYEQNNDNNPNNATLRAYQMDVSLLHANKDATIIAEDSLAYYENYFLPFVSTSAFTAHAFKKITYKNVYPNIDWVLYIKNNAVEYDFDVHPGGKVTDIKLQYTGATDIALDKNGSIVATTPFGMVEEKKPVAYIQETGKSVASAFKLNNNILSFETENFDGTLVIDPFIGWSTYFGGANDDVATGVATTATSLLYVCGTAKSIGLETVGAAYGGGTSNAFIASYTAGGTLIWASYYGGGGTDVGNAVAVDAAGNIYLTGTTNGSAGLGTFLAYQGGNAGGNDAYLAQFSNAGLVNWSTYYGGTGDEFSNAITIDNTTGDIYIAGQTNSTSGISTGGAFSSALSGATDGFFAKFDNLGANLLYGSYFGGSGQDKILAITTDFTGNVAFTGQTNSTNTIATTTAYQSVLSGTNDAFIEYFSSTGGQLYGTYFGGPGQEQGNGILFNFNHDIVVIGNTTSSSQIASTGAWQTTFGGGLQDAFIAVIGSTFTRKWSTYYGGSGDDYGQAICLDPNGYYAIAGMTYSTTGIAGNSGFQLSLGGDYDAFVSKFDTLGRRIWGSYFGSTFYDWAYGIACDANNLLTFVGKTNDGTNIATATAQQSTIGGGIDGGAFDAFVTRVAPDTNVFITQPFTDTLICAGNILDTFYVAYNTSSGFQPGNQFVVQLSDITGSFAAPITIGSVTATSTGIVKCILPTTTPVGSGYRIRIYGTNPITFSPDDYLNIKVISSVSSLTPATVQSSSPACVGNTISLYVTAPYSIYSLSWTGPLSYTSNNFNPIISPAVKADSGMYYVTVVHNGCQGVLDSTLVQINDFTPPTPSDSVGPSVCVGFPLYLFAKPDTIASPIKYEWSGPAGFSSTLKNPVIPSITIANAGTYTLRDTVAGCPSSLQTINITLLPIIPASVTISVNPTPTQCKGTDFTFTTSSINPGFDPAYQWYTGLPATPISGAVFNNYSSSYLTNGEEIWCVLTSSAPCASPTQPTSNVITLHIIDSTPTTYIVATPDSVVTPGQNITFTDYVTNLGSNITYQWQIDGVNVTGANSNTFTLNMVDSHVTIDCEVFSNATCANPNYAFSNTIGTHTTTDVNNISGSFDHLVLYPNPNSGKFNLIGSLYNYYDDKYTVSVINAVGQIIYQSEKIISTDKINEVFDFSNLSDGIYLLRLSAAGNNKILKFTVSK